MITSGAAAGEAEAATVLGPLRDRLDELDRRLLALVVERMDLCLDIARLKAEHGIPMMQPSRVGLVVGRARAHAAAHGLPEEYLGDLYERIVAETCAQEDVLIAELDGAGER
ncbi:chorismate mutase [Streptomyces sp. NBC_00704]|uniref:chorismate mutase n=1 Tax=Streptomyces sp. NBC_00704 TaxID=2975809 RepID=UPI002E303179|nr:chorismate mutase [Streptomyces sp. NBC_00704]